MAAEFYYNDNNSVRKAKEVYYNDNGTIRKAKEIWYNDNGTMRLVYKLIEIISLTVGYNDVTIGGQIERIQSWGYSSIVGEKFGSVNTQEIKGGYKLAAFRASIMHLPRGRKADQVTILLFGNHTKRTLSFNLNKGAVVGTSVKTSLASNGSYTTFTFSFSVNKKLREYLDDKKNKTFPLVITVK